MAELNCYHLLILLNFSCSTALDIAYFSDKMLNLRQKPNAG